MSRVQRCPVTSIKPPMTPRLLMVALVLMALSISTPLTAQQLARPVTTASAGPFTVVGAGSHHLAIDETVANGNTDYINATADGSCEVTLGSLTDPNSATGHIIRVSFYTNPVGGAKERVAVGLYQGTTLIATTGALESVGAWSATTYTLTAPQADAITNYSDLRFQITASGSWAGGEFVRLSWAELEVPSAATTVPTLSAPSIANVDSTTTDLGATIDGNGGAAITVRGTVWDISSTPTGAIPSPNALAEGGTMLGAFAHTRNGLPAGVLVYFRGYATNVAGTGYSPEGTFYTEPTAATGVSFSLVTETSMRVSWTNGSNLTALVVIHANTATTGLPTDYNDTYSANPIYGSGTDLGSQNFVVFKAAGSFVDITGLTSATTYHVSVFSYAGSGASVINYQQTTPAVGSQATASPTPVPTLSSPTSTSINTTSATLGATIDSDNGSALSERGTLWNTTGAPVLENGKKINGGVPLGVFSHSRSGLPVGTEVFYRGYAINGNGTGTSPTSSFFTEPTAASGVVISNVSTSGMRIQWTSGSNTTAMVLVKANTAVDQAPLDNTVYTANSVFGSGTPLGTGNFMVFLAAGAQVDVTGLTSNTTYHVAVYAYAGSGTATNVQQDTPATGNATTLVSVSLPTLSSPTMSGIGSTSATLGATVDSGAPLTARGTVWNSTGAPVVQNILAQGGTTAGVFTHLRSSLPAAALVFFRGYATNGAGTAYSPGLSFYTEPGVQVSGLTLTPDWQTLTIGWTPGTGSGAIVLVRALAAVNSNPVDGVIYSPAQDFGSGTQLGTGNYVVYVAAGTTALVTGLTPNTQYHVAVYALMGNTSGVGGINYLQTSPAVGFASTTNPPSGHNASNGIECADCHMYVSAGAGSIHGDFRVPRDVFQETVCTSCHNPTGVASTMADVGLHTVDGGATLVDCGSCHEVHNNQDFSGLDHLSNPATNLRLIRKDTAKYRASALEPALFFNDGSRDVYAFAVGDTPYNGICQTCHTNTNNHTNDGSSTGAGSNDHQLVPSPVACTGCHTHVGGFLATGGACTDCHKSTSDVQDSTYSNGTKAVIDATEWTSFGHGGGGAGFDAMFENGCPLCHDSSIDHGVPNIYRLANFGSNQTCLKCHAAGSTGYDPDGAGSDFPSAINATKKVGTAHYGSKHGGTNAEGGKLCWDCHDPHGDDTNPTGAGTGYEFMIQRNPVEDHDGTYGIPITVAAQLTSFDAAGGLSGSSLDFTDYVLADFKGLCQVCHDDVISNYNKTTYADHNRTWNFDLTNAPNNRCTDCHSHDAEFKASGDCIGCHTGVANDGGIPRRPVVADFSAAGSHHVDHVGRAVALSIYDCALCHLEGDALGGTTSVHKDGIVNLRDVDGNVSLGFSYVDTDTSANGPSTGACGAAPANTYRRALTYFCLGCHDANGANGAFVATLSTNDPELTRTAFNPFGDSNSPLDVSSLFDPAHTSTHSLSCYKSGASFVSGQKNPAYTIQAATWINAWTSSSTTECADCHLPGATGAAQPYTNNAHGATANPYLLDNSSGADVAIAAATTATCFKCHQATAYTTDDATGGSRYPEHDKGAHQATALSTYGSQTNIWCFNCHGGAGDRTLGGIHGESDTILGSPGTPPAVQFFNGAGINIWHSLGGSSYSCGANNASSYNLGCSNHGTGRTYTRQNYP